MASSETSLPRGVTRVGGHIRLRSFLALAQQLNVAMSGEDFSDPLPNAGEP